MAVVAKFRLASVEEIEYWKGGTAKRVKLNAVQGEPFGEATPSGSIDMLIVNPDAHAQFHIGREYHVTFEEVAK